MILNSSAFIYFRFGSSAASLKKLWEENNRLRSNNADLYRKYLEEKTKNVFSKNKNFSTSFKKLDNKNSKNTVSLLSPSSSKCNMSHSLLKHEAIKTKKSEQINSVLNSSRSPVEISNTGIFNNILSNSKTLKNPQSNSQCFFLHKTSVNKFNKSIDRLADRQSEMKEKHHLINSMSDLGLSTHPISKQANITSDLSAGVFLTKTIKKEKIGTTSQLSLAVSNSIDSVDSFLNSKLTSYNLNNLECTRQETSTENKIDLVKANTSDLNSQDKSSLLDNSRGIFSLEKNYELGTKSIKSDVFQTNFDTKETNYKLDHDTIQPCIPLEKLYKNCTKKSSKNNNALVSLDSMTNKSRLMTRLAVNLSKKSDLNSFFNSISELPSTDKTKILSTNYDLNKKKNDCIVLSDMEDFQTEKQNRSKKINSFLAKKGSKRKNLDKNAFINKKSRTKIELNLKSSCDKSQEPEFSPNKTCDSSGRKIHRISLTQKTARKRPSSNEVSPSKLARLSKFIDQKKDLGKKLLVEKINAKRDTTKALEKITVDKNENPKKIIGKSKRKETKSQNNSSLKKPTNAKSSAELFNELNPTRKRRTAAENSQVKTKLQLSNL